MLVSYEEDLNKEYFSSFINAIKSDGLLLEVEPRPPIGMQAS